MSRGRLLTLGMLGLLMAAPASFAQDQGNQGQDQGQGQNQEGERPRRQRQGRGPGGGGGNFDPEQMRQRMAEAQKERLGATDEEWTVIQPKLEKVMTALREARPQPGFGRGGGRGGRGPGGPGGPDGAQAESPTRKARQELRDAVENNASAEDIAAKLKSLREARDKAREELASAQKELQSVVTAKQEAILVMEGTLE